VNQALGLIEVGGYAPAMVALDVLDKTSNIRLVQAELNDQLGVLIKVTGESAAVAAAVAAAESVVHAMLVAVVVDVINAPDQQTWKAAQSPREFSPLLEADVVFSPKESKTVNGSFALGLIETQGLTAVLEALDTAAKAANVEVVGKEKLGGGYVTVIFKGDVAAVQAAVEAGKARVEGLGKLIAAHVIARPSEAVLSLLPKT
jgi:carbon dioxide concentrating mechanism protein CcmO